MYDIYTHILFDIYSHIVNKYVSMYIEYSWIFDLEPNIFYFLYHDTQERSNVGGLYSMLVDIPFLDKLQIAWRLKTGDLLQLVVTPKK